MIGGNCTVCKEYHIANTHKTGCIRPICENPRDYINELGECVTCEDYKIRNPHNDIQCIR